MTDIWKPAQFELAHFTGPMAVAGYVYRGLGLSLCEPRRGDLWNLSHLGTGHLLAMIDGRVAVAFPIATEIAEAGDWDFLSLEGFIDRFPNAPERLREICEAHAAQVPFFASGDPIYMHDESSRAVAQQIAANRP